jgi:hypothetical protein
MVPIFHYSTHSGKEQRMRGTREFRIVLCNPFFSCVAVLNVPSRILVRLLSYASITGMSIWRYVGFGKYYYSRATLE